MKKSVVLGFAVVVAFAASLTAFAHADANEPACDHHVCTHVEVESQGRGACTVPNCKCASFNQRPGYNQCYCGHQSFSHK